MVNVGSDFTIYGITATDIKEVFPDFNDKYVYFWDINSCRPLTSWSGTPATVFVNAQHNSWTVHNGGNVAQQYELQFSVRIFNKV